MALSCKNLLGIGDLEVDDVRQIIETAGSFREVFARPIKKLPTLRGRSIINLFYEPSTRTRSSFEFAAKRLGADAINFSVSSSSVAKGESLIDTGLSLQAMSPDIIVIRHQHAGAPHLLARVCLQSHIVNGGDGMHEHPTQALLDLLTITDHKGEPKGRKVAIVGDISRSRVARSNALLLRKMGAEVWICGPPTMIPIDFHQYEVQITFQLEEALKSADVVMLLRVQKERLQDVLYPSVKEYFALFGLNKKKLRRARPDCIVMHPGPINRGVEIDPELADGEYSVILEQVTNGVAVRMAVLYLLLGGELA